MQRGHDEELYGKDEQGKIYPIYTVWEGKDLLSFCPLCQDPDPDDELTLLIDKAKGTMKCRQCEGTLEVVGKEEIMPLEPKIKKAKKAAKLRSKKKEKDEYQEKSKKVKGQGEFEFKYIYYDPKGKKAHATLRWKNPKGFSQQYWDGKEWQTGLGPKKITYLYNLVKIIKSKGMVIVGEGEKDADMMMTDWGLMATTAPMGAGKWKNEYSEWLSGKDLVLIPDQNDEKEKNLGIESMERVAYMSMGKAKSIKIILLPRKDKKIFGYDPCNWKEEGGTREKLLALIEKTKEVDLKKLVKKVEKRMAKKTKAVDLGVEGIVRGEKFNPRPYSDFIIENYKLIYDGPRRRFFWYDKTEGIWKDNFEPKLNDLLRKEILPKMDLKKNKVSEILEDLKGLVYYEDIPPEPDNYLIPFKNGIYDLRDNKFLDFDPKYFFIQKMAVNYNPKNKECPRVQKLFEQIVNKEDVITLYEIIAYTFFRGYPYPKMFMLYGSGANGKSRFAKVMNKILGKKNISGASLNTLQNSPFGTSQLFGKLANISIEMSYGALGDSTVLRGLTGGDENIEAQRKFKHPFEFENYAKLIFLSNEIPWSKDKSFAFYRRIFLLEFPRRYKIKKRQEIIESDHPNLSSIKTPKPKFADPFIIERIPVREFEGLAYKCLELLKELSNEKVLFTFTRHEATEEITEKYERLSDPLGTFLEETTEIDPEEDIPVRAFNQEFKEWQKKKGLRQWTDNLISKVMSERGILKRTVNLSTSIKGDWRGYKGYLEIKWKVEKI